MSDNTMNRRPVAGYELLYSVSEEGGVFKKNGSPLKPKVTRGYFAVGLCKNGHRKMMRVSRLIALAFIPNPTNRTQVNHINGVTTDNRVSNLEWSTPKENCLHRAKVMKKGIGEDQSSSVFTADQVLEIRQRLNNGEKQNAIAKQYKVFPNTIFKIKHRLSWTHI